MADSENTRAFYNSTIPSEWAVMRLSEMTTLLTNGFVGKAKDHYVESDAGILYIQGYNVTESGFNHFGIKRVSAEFHERNRKSCLKEGDLLTIQTGQIGLTSIVPKELAGSNCHALVISRLKNNLAHPNFFLHYFNSEIGTRQFKRIETGSTMKHLNVGDMESLQFPIPPLSEQKAIARVLGLMDGAINQNNQLIAQKELRKKWLMQNLLTGKKRLTGFTDEWKESKLSDSFVRVTRKNTEVCTNVVTISAQRGFVRQTDFFNKSIASETLDNYFLVHHGEYCYNKSYSNGYPWGATKRLNDFDKAVVTTLYICFGIRDPKMTDGEFFEQFFEANSLDRGLTRIAHEGGRAHGLLNVTPSDFFSLSITVPNFDEQTAISKVLQAADKEITLLKTKTEKLREQKKGMMQQLLTGKKRLRLD